MKKNSQLSNRRKSLRKIMIVGVKNISWLLFLLQFMLVPSLAEISKSKIEKEVIQPMLVGLEPDPSNLSGMNDEALAGETNQVNERVIEYADEHNRSNSDQEEIRKN